MNRQSKAFYTISESILYIFAIIMHIFPRLFTFMKIVICPDPQLAEQYSLSSTGCYFLKSIAIHKIQ